MESSGQTALFTIILLYANGLQLSWCQCLNTTEVSIQVDSLLAEYDREVLPSNQEAVLVQLSLDVKHAYINQKDSTMKLQADLRMKWQDNRIVWNDTEWRCDYAITSAERLWLPDIVLLNAASTGFTSSPIDVGLKARINFDGTVSWVMRLDLTAPISLELYDWPNDKQSCTFKFGSRAYNLKEIKLHINEPNDPLPLNGEWTIEDMDDDVSVWNRDDDQLSVALWTLHVTRRAPAHSLAANVVVVAAAFMLAAAVALPPDQRHSLAACASFMAAFWLITCLIRLPGAHTCPRVMCVMCALCVCGAACGACAALARRVALLTAPPPRVLRNMLHSLSGVCSLTPSTDTPSSAESGAWAAAALLIDRTLCTALLLTVIILLIVQVS